VTIEALATSRARGSVTYSWEIRRDGEICVRGRHTAVHVDPTADRRRSDRRCGTRSTVLGTGKGSKAAPPPNRSRLRHTASVRGVLGEQTLGSAAKQFRGFPLDGDNDRSISPVEHPP